MGVNTVVPHRPDDIWGLRVRILTAVIAIMLSIFTICAHRSHAKAAELQKEITGLWTHYQAKRTRDYQLELNAELVKMVAKKKSEAKQILSAYAKQHEAYSAELSTIKHDADELSLTASNVHSRALYLDLSVVVMEISLIMCSLYFIASKKLYPVFGVVAGALGSFVALFSILF